MKKSIQRTLVALAALHVLAGPAIAIATGGGGGGTGDKPPVKTESAPSARR